MEVAAEFSAARPASHARHDLVANDECTDVFAVRFSDVFLYEDRLSCHQQALNEVANFKRRVPKKHPVTLGALRDFDHHGKATNGFDGLLHVQDVTYVDRFGNGNSVSGEDLGGVEFVSALQDALAGVGGPDAQLLNVAKHGDAVLRDGMADARNDGIFRKGTAAMQDIDTALIDDEGEFHRVANFDVQTPLLGFLNNTTRTVEARASAQHGQSWTHVVVAHGVAFHSTGSHEGRFFAPRS